MTEQIANRKDIPRHGCCRCSDGTSADATAPGGDGPGVGDANVGSTCWAAGTEAAPTDANGDGEDGDDVARRGPALEEVTGGDRTKGRSAVPRGRSERARR